MAKETPPGTPDIISRVRFDGVARNTTFVKVSIVVPALISQPVYGELVAEVKVFSRVKVGYHQRGIFNIKPLSQREARQKAGIVGGALAERVMEVIQGEKMSAVECANEAMSAWDNALARFESKQFTPLPKDRTLEAILEALSRTGELG